MEVKLFENDTSEHLEEDINAFLEDKGLMQLNNDSFGPYSPWAVHTKLGWMCSFSDHDVLTYMGHGIWDLRVYKPSEEEKELLEDIDGMEF